MGRKKVADMNTEELKVYRGYMRKAKAKSRENKPPEKDNRRSRNRAEYMRNYRAKKKEE